MPDCLLHQGPTSWLPTVPRSIATPHCPARWPLNLMPSWPAGEGEHPGVYAGVEGEGQASPWFPPGDIGFQK